MTICEAPSDVVHNSNGIVCEDDYLADKKVLLAYYFIEKQVRIAQELSYLLNESTIPVRWNGRGRQL